MAEYVDFGVRYLRSCCSINFLIYMVTFSLDIFAQPMGSPWAADLSGLFEAVGIRIGLALVLPPAIGFKGILDAQALSPMLPCVVGGFHACRFEHVR